MPRKSGETPRIAVPPIGLAPVSVHTAEGHRQFPDGVHARPPQTDEERVAADSRLTPSSFEYRRLLAEQLGVDVARVPVSRDAQAVFVRGLRPIRETKLVKEKKVIKVTVYRAPQEQSRPPGKRKQEKLNKRQDVRKAADQMRRVLEKGTRNIL